MHIELEMGIIGLNGFNLRQLIKTIALLNLYTLEMHKMTYWVIGPELAEWLIKLLQMHPLLFMLEI